MKRLFPLRTRKLLLLAMLLVAGAIVNVAVAWGCSWWGVPRFAAVEPMGPKAFWNNPKICPGLTESEVPFWNNYTLSPELTTSDLPVVVSKGPGFVEGWAFVALMTGARNLSPERFSEVLQKNLEADTAGDDFLEGIMNGTIQAQNAKYISLRTDAGWPSHGLRGWGPATHASYQEAMGYATRWMHSGNALVLLRKVPGVRGGRLVRVLPLRPIWPGFAINTVFYAALLWLMFAAPFALRRSIRRRRGLCPACAYPVGDGPVCTECGAPKVSGATGGGTHKAVNL